MITVLVFLILICILLAGGLVGFYRHGPGRLRWLIPGLATTVALIGLAFMLAAAAFFPMLADDPSPSILYALPMAAPLAVLCGFLAIVLQRVFSPLGSINPVLPAAVLALTLAASLMGLTGWHRLGNGLLDTSPEQPRQAVVMETRGKKAVVEWDNGRRKELRGNFEAVRPGARLTITVRKGYYRQPWISNVTIQEP